MDAAFFLKRRTDFIRFLYDGSIKSFTKIKQQIESKEPPFDNPPYSEDGEPAFLEQWMDAETAIDLVGLSCVSLLSDTLKLYFQTLEKRVIGFSFPDEKSQVFRAGFLDAYKIALSEILQIDWSDSPVDFAIIEQVVLARNRGQHGGDLTSLDVSHDNKTLIKHSHPYFASLDEWTAWSERGGDPKSLFKPALQISREQLFLAVGEVEKLVQWIDERLDRVWDWRKRSKSSTR